MSGENVDVRGTLDRLAYALQGSTVIGEIAEAREAVTELIEASGAVNGILIEWRDSRRSLPTNRLDRAINHLAVVLAKVQL